MSNNKMQTPEVESEEFFDFSPAYDDACSHDSMIDTMSGLLEASNNQMLMAIELTKLIVSHSPAGKNMEEQVFSVFKRATQLIGENHALKNIMAQIEQMEE